MADYGLWNVGARLVLCISTIRLIVEPLDVGEQEMKIKNALKEAYLQIYWGKGIHRDSFAFTVHLTFIGFFFSS